MPADTKTFIYCAINYIYYYETLGEWLHLHVFSAIFTKGNNFCDFLFASLDDKAYLKLGLLLKEGICCQRSKLFPIRHNSHLEGSLKMAELLPFHVHIHLKENQKVP